MAYWQRYSYCFTETEEVRLSPEEQCYYEERFDNAVIAFDQLEIAEVIGEGANI